MKKRVISLLLALVLAVSLLPTAAWAAEEKPQQGSGTADDPYLIDNAEKLEWFRDRVSGDASGTPYRTECAKLTNDITLGSWTPFAPGDGYATSAFGGTFDGNGHTISGLTGSNGLFVSVKDATIQNLKVVGTISGTATYVGGIVGKTQGSTQIKNCSFSGSVTSTTDKSNYSYGVGGIVGNANGTLTVTSCANHATVTATNGCPGGIVGYAGSNKITISNCYNDGTISGQYYPSGICGTNTNNKTASTITNCYNAGSISNGAGISANFRTNTGSVTSCYRTQPVKETFSNNEAGISILLTSDNLKTTLEGIGFKVSNDGKVYLPWEGGEVAKKHPRISISGPNTLQMVNNGPQPTTKLTVAYTDIDNKTPVDWSVDKSDIVKVSYPENPDANNTKVILQAVNPGTVKVTATAGEYTDKYTVTVYPFVTGVEIAGKVAIGETVSAKVSVFGGGEYEYDEYPDLNYAWQYITAEDYSKGNTGYNSYHPIQGATGREFTIPDDMVGDYLSVYVTYNGNHYDPGSPTKIADTDRAIVDKDASALYEQFTDLVIKAPENPVTLDLKTSGDNGSTISWSSDNEAVINPQSGVVTLPSEGIATVKLTAELTHGSVTITRTYTITVWSQAAVEAEANDKRLALNNDIDAANISVLTPVFGTDTNVLTMVKNRLGCGDIAVSITKVVRNGAEDEASGIAANGDISYFYADPNQTADERLQWFGSYTVTFSFVRGDAAVTREVPVTVYWDVEKVERVMRGEILSQVDIDTNEPVTEDFELPRIADGKKWTLISWQSSDPAITISTKKQTTADTLFDPYVAVVRGGSAEKKVTLTANFTFQLANSSDETSALTLQKIFIVNVAPSADGEKYQKALNAVFGEGSLTDAASGERLAAANGVFTVRNDIQFPTTRDLGAYMMAQFGEGFDGKYTPVVITSSDPGVIEAPTTPNSARVWVYRPLPGEAAKTVTLTMKILDRPNGPQPGVDPLASKEIKVTVQPLTQAEIDAEIALMERVKAHYWDGIRNANTDQNNVTTDLHAFQKCYLNDNGELTWVYDREDLKNQGIVPVPLDNWYDQQIWRLFRSSNADVVAHENLLVTRQGDSKAVTITSYLSSETLGRYAEKYPQNADFQKLYKQPVTADLVVTGTQYAQGNNEGRVQAVKRALAARPTVTVSFSLSGRGMGFAEESGLEYAEGSTVYDVFSDLLVKHGYTCKRRGSYIAAITSNSGVTLEEFDEGKNSGWMYRVNGELVGRYMSAQGLKDGDSIELYFTSDWTSEPGAEGWQKPGKIETIVNADGSVTKIETKPDGTIVETTTKPDGGTVVAETKPDGSVSTVEKRADGTEIKTAQPVSGEITASVSVPKSVGSTRVDIPVSKPSGSMVAVIVHPDGTEEIVRGSVVTETGVALRAEGDVRLKIIDNAKRFNDMADHWAKDAVEFASSRELFNGVGNDAFGPDFSMTRGMVSTVLARLAGADTAGGETWYAKGTVWAVENGISDGTAPEQPVTREQLAAMLYRYAGSPAVSGELGFDDADSISAWARDAVRWCVDNGILNGVGGNRMTPQDLARRGQVAAMLMRFLQATV